MDHGSWIMDHSSVIFSFVLLFLRTEPSSWIWKIGRWADKGLLWVAILGRGVGDGGKIKRRSFLPPQRQKKYEVYVCYIDLRASNTFRYYSVDQGWYLNRIIQRWIRGRVNLTASQRDFEMKANDFVPKWQILGLHDEEIMVISSKGFSQLCK